MEERMKYWKPREAQGHLGAEKVNQYIKCNSHQINIPLMTSIYSLHGETAMSRKVVNILDQSLNIVGTLPWKA